MWFYYDIPEYMKVQKLAKNCMKNLGKVKGTKEMKKYAKEYFSSRRAETWDKTFINIKNKSITLKPSLNNAWGCFTRPIKKTKISESAQKIQKQSLLSTLPNMTFHDLFEITDDNIKRSRYMKIGNKFGFSIVKTEFAKNYIQEYSMERLFADPFYFEVAIRKGKQECRYGDIFLFDSDGVLRRL